MSYGLYYFTEAIAYIIESPLLFVSKSIFLVILSLSVSIGLDLMGKDRPGAIKISLITTLGGLTLYTAFNPESAIPYIDIYGFTSYKTSGAFFIFMLALTLIIAVQYLHVMIKIKANTPKELEKYGLLNIIAAVIIGPVVIILYFLRVSVIAPGILGIFTSIGALLSSIVFAKHPKLAYVLPTRVYKLVIVDRKSGLLLFNHTWQVSNPDKALEDLRFSGLVHGIVHFVKESMLKEDLKEIKTDNAVLLVRNSEDSPYLVIILASKSTRTLRQAFGNFCTAFETYRRENKDANVFQMSSENTNTKETILDGMISHYFPYIPHFVQNPPEAKIKPNTPPKSQTERLKELNALCISCRNVRDTDGEWQSFMEFYQKNLNRSLAWGICPTCQSQTDFLSLSIFDNRLGPRTIVQLPTKDEPEQVKDLAGLMDLRTKGFFMLTINDISVANYSFVIKSDTARGGEISLALSYFVINSTTNEKFARKFLKQCANEIQTLNREIFNIKLKRNGELGALLLDPNSDEYQRTYKLIRKNLHLIPEKKIEYYLESLKI